MSDANKRRAHEQLYQILFEDTRAGKTYHVDCHEITVSVVIPGALTTGDMRGQIDKRIYSMTSW
jgi:hypothetical protein